MSLQIVSITSQGQLTIPKSIRKALGISSRTKAVIEMRGKELVVKPKEDFWSLGGALQSAVRLDDKELSNARAAFTTQWAKP